MAEQTSSAFRLYLLRHAKAGWAEPGKSDFDRALDDQGFAEAELIADEIADQGYRPDAVISSTAVRCRQTAEALRRSLGEELNLAYVDSLYSGPIDVYGEIAFAAREERSLMIVGHNPMIEELFHRLLGHAIAEAAAPFGYPTGALAVIDYDERPNGTPLDGGRLSGLITPRSGG